MLQKESWEEKKKKWSDNLFWDFSPSRHFFWNDMGRCVWCLLGHHHHIFIHKQQNLYQRKSTYLFSFQKKKIPPIIFIVSSGMKVNLVSYFHTTMLCSLIINNNALHTKICTCIFLFSALPNFCAHILAPILSPHLW